MALVYYRGTQFIQDWTVRYLTGLFLANEKGQLPFFDGTKKLVFSQRPTVIKRASWVARDLPVVLIGEAHGSYKTLSFTKDLINESTATETIQKRTVGGDIEITLDLMIRATTKEECSMLADITGIYLAGPTAKDFYMQQYLKLPEPPSIGGITDIHEPAIDHPIYEATLSFPVVGTWRDEEDLADRLLDIIVDITAELDL